MSAAEATYLPSGFDNLVEEYRGFKNATVGRFRKTLEDLDLPPKQIKSAVNEFQKKLKIPDKHEGFITAVAGAAENVRERILPNLDSDKIAQEISKKTKPEDLRKGTSASSCIDSIIRANKGVLPKEEYRELAQEKATLIEEVKPAPPKIPRFIPRGWDAFQHSRQTGKILGRALSPFTAATISNPDLLTPIRLPAAIGFDLADRFTGGKLSANVAAYSLVAQNPKDAGQTMGFMLRTLKDTRQQIEGYEKLIASYKQKGGARNKFRAFKASKELKSLRKSYGFNQGLFKSLSSLKMHVDKMGRAQKLLYGTAARFFRLGHFMGKLSNNITTIAFAAPYLFTDPSRFALVFTNQLLAYRAYDVFHTHVIDKITGKIKTNFLKSTLGKGLLSLGARFAGKRLTAWGAALIAGAPSGGLSIILALGTEAFFFLNRQFRITDRLKDLASGASIAFAFYLSKLSLAGLIGGALGGLGGGIIGGIVGFSVGGPLGAGIGFVLGGGVGFFLGSKIGEIFAPALGPISGATTLAEGVGIGGGLEGGAAVPEIATAVEGPLATYAVSGSALGLGSIVVGGLAVSIITASAFFIPYQAGPSPWEKQSEYVSATKTVAYNNQALVSGQKINQVNQGDVFVYEVEISATQSNLTNVRVKDIIQTVQATGVNPIESFEQSNIEISPGASWTTSYSISVDDASLFQNSILSNTLVITADVPGENLTDEQFVVSTQIIVGTPPEDCPYLWPVHERYRITQGPNCTPATQEERAQGYFCSHAGEQAIDIGFKGVVGIPIYSTHAGAINFNVDTVGCKGNYATITSICNGVPFSTIYAHLHSFESSLSSGQHVSANQLIGLSGNSSKDPASCSTGPHLHYATWGLGDIAKFLQSVDGKIEPDCGRSPNPPSCGFTPR